MITDALRRARLSARTAARQAGISEGRWRQIAHGYQVVSSGVYAPVHGPAATVARMAAVAGLTPAELAAAGRPDAADLLADEPGPGAGEDMLARVRAMNQDQARELLAAIAVQLGVTLPGTGPAGPQPDPQPGPAAAPAAGQDRERRYGT